MCRNSISLCTYFVLLINLSAFAATPGPYSDIQLTSFELETGPWEHWNDESDWSFSTIGVTDGSWSLRVDMAYPTENFWYSTEMGMKFIGEERQAFWQNEYMTMDVTTLAAEWMPNTNAGWIFGTDISLIVNAGDDDGHQMWEAIQGPTWRPDLADLTQTITWNYKAQQDTIRTWNMNQTEGWLEFVLLMRWPTYEPPPDGTGDGGVYYLDNNWLHIPEPTTIALLGLGSLALLRRKR